MHRNADVLMLRLKGAAESELLTKTIGKWVSNRTLAVGRMEFQPIRQAAELEEQKRALGVFGPAPRRGQSWKTRRRVIGRRRRAAYAIQ
jgi:hypothetical protein